MSITLNFYTITSLLIFITSTLFGLAVFFENRKALLNRAFGLFALSVSGWSLFYYIWQISTTENNAILFTRLLMAFAIFIPANYFFIVLVFLKRYKNNIWQLAIAYIISCVFLVLDATPLMVRSVEPTKFHNLWPMAGAAFTIFLAIWFLIVLYPSTLLYRAYEHSESEDRKKQIMIILIGIFLAFLGGSTNYFLWYNIPIPPVGNVIGPIWVVLISYAIVKHKLLNIRLISAEIALYFINGIVLVELIFSKTMAEFVYRIVLLTVLAYVTYIAIKSIKSEIRQNQLLERDKKELVQLDRMKDEFLQMATHELNTPITVIQGQLSMAITENMCKLDQEQKKFLEPVLTNTTRLANLSRDILNVARIDQHRLSINPAETDLDALVAQIVTGLEIKAKTKGNALTYIAPTKSLPKVMIDQTKIGEVITNLVNNANKFTDKGKITVTSELKNGKIIISVADTGIGIEKKDQKYLFEKFYQAGRFDPNDPREQQGSGLGLYISRNIIRLHGGEIWLESEQDKGSTFYFSLPQEYKEVKRAEKIHSDGLKLKVL